MTYRLSIAAAALLLCSAATAHAGTLTTFGQSCKDNECTASARFTAAPGEGNHLVVSHSVGLPGEPIYVRIVDTTPILDDAVNCAMLTSYYAECSADSLAIELGDRNDTVDSAVPILFDAGPGDDRVTAPIGSFGTCGSGADWLFGNGVGMDCERTLAVPLL